MNEQALDNYCAKAIEMGATHARQINPKSVVTAGWVRLKCQFGCPGYNRGYCCPPDTPAPEVTRSVLDSYNRAILFHKEVVKLSKQLMMTAKKNYFEMLVDMEGDIFKDGYYKAFLLLMGPCYLCKECGKLRGEDCNFKHRARPSMEACGIDVFQTARNNGFFIETLKERTDTQNLYCLMLVD